MRTLKTIKPSVSLSIKPVYGKNVIIDNQEDKDFYDEFMSLQTLIDKYSWLKNKRMTSVYYKAFIYNYSENKVTISDVSYGCSSIAKNYHPEHNINASFTVYADGDVKFWQKFNKSQVYNILSYFFDFLDCKEKESERLCYSLCMCKTTISKIVLGKITNKEQLLREYIKVNRLKISRKNFIHSIKTWNCSVFDVEKAFDNVDLLYEKGTIDELNRQGVLHDMIEDAILLNKKYKSSWSIKRMLEEHSNRQREITKKILEKNTASEISVLEKTFSYKGFEQINSEKRAFEESMMMSNCVYNCYWNSIKNKDYVCFHILNKDIYDGNDGITVGLTFNRMLNDFIFDQAHGIRNSILDEKTLKKIKRICEGKQMKKYLEYVKSNRETENEVPLNVIGTGDFENFELTF